MKLEDDILKWFEDEDSKPDFADKKQAEVLRKIKHYSAQIDSPKIDSEQALSEFKSNYLGKKDTKVRTLDVRMIYKVAAAAVILLTISYFTFFNVTRTFETQIAETVNFNLPDNSEVILNANSKVAFNKRKWDEQRNLTLDGEAFFKVTKGQKFSVKTDQGTVEVLGTQFNVNERDNYFEVKCFEGLVAVTYNGATIQLPNGTSFRIVDGIADEIDETTGLQPSWLSNESSFVEVPFKEVIAEFERQFDLKIKFDDIDESQLFTGSFTHKDQNIALQSITIPLQLSYSIKGKTVTIYKYEEN